MSATRIDFLSGDAARFNDLRDKWRSVASSCALSKAGLRVATVLPTFISREYGYAFPTDEDLASAIGTTNTSTAKRGLISLEGADLIERQTMVKRDEKGEAIGRLRRIHFKLPEVKVQNHPEVKVQKVKVQDEVKVQKRVGEGSPVCTNIPDSITPDKISGSGIKTVTVSLYARENVPSAYANDNEFLDTFDRIVIEMTEGKEIGAGEMSKICETAFNRTTDSSDMFMPFHWADVCMLRSKETEQWFYQRVGQLVYRRNVA
ncbi:hypothetical protein [Agrobacterium sp. P15N1-A]|uniref:hypothetical protein n=1 Tax=Agrobacterium sp. P15N1-A TaxID=3342820 RepID=UPI0037D64E0A